MSIEDRRARERLAQRRLITTATRQLAEDEGWDAVTTRRLAALIEYSQPVIYKHFASLDDLSEAVALEGFDELAAELRAARDGVADGRQVAVVAAAYLAFADRHPALYDAMFTRSTRLEFGSEATPASLAAAYGEIRSAVETIAGERGVETLTEVVWSSLHGLIALGRSGRLRPDAAAARLALLIATVTP